LCTLRRPAILITMLVQDSQKFDTQKFVAVVDDDDSMRSALKDLMEESGFAAFSCASAEEFLQSANKRYTACLITDIRMPGMSGLELQAKLNADHQRIPIIFITAHGDEDIRLRAMRAGAVEFLAKPFDDETLLECVRAALNG
jgi:FixJ family two-component response regulator